MRSHSILRSWPSCSSRFPARADGLPDGRYLYVAAPGHPQPARVRRGRHPGLRHRQRPQVRQADRDRREQRGASRDNIKGVCACAATQTALLHHAEEALLRRSRDREDALGEGTAAGLRPHVDHAGRQDRSTCPSFEKDIWNVVDAATGEVDRRRSRPKSGAHNTVVGLDGSRMYLAGLQVAAAVRRRHEDAQGRRHGRPVRRRRSGRSRSTGRRRSCFVNVNELLGFEIGDLKTGKKLHRVEVQGFKKGPVKRHGCPSHGIGLTPDEKEVWVVRRLQPAGPRLRRHGRCRRSRWRASTLREQPGWVTFSLDGRYAYPSTGEVIDTATKKIVDGPDGREGPRGPQREDGGDPLEGRQGRQTGDQFGVGRVVK